MGATKKIYWVIRAGKKGDAHEVFLRTNLIVLNHQNMGNLAEIDPNREAFYASYRKSHPDESKTSVTGIGGKFFRFVHEMQVGDAVLYPSLKRGKRVYVGEVIGGYNYDSSMALFPHQRCVRWIHVFSKSILTQSALYELGTARTFFCLKRHADEVNRLVSENRVERYTREE